MSTKAILTAIQTTVAGTRQCGLEQCSRTALVCQGHVALDIYIVGTATGQNTQ